MFRNMRRNFFRKIITRNNDNNNDQDEESNNRNNHNSSSIPTVLSLVEEEEKRDPNDMKSYNLDSIDNYDIEDSHTANTGAAGSLTDEQVDDCKEAFRVFVDLEGYVDITKIGAMIRALGEKITEDEEHALIEEYKLTRGDKINFYQFMDIMTPRIIQINQVYNEVSIEKLFKEFDIDGDGYITAPELRQSLQILGSNFAALAQELTDEDVEEIIMESDLDGDGRISYSEFAIMIPRLNAIMEE